VFDIKYLPQTTIKGQVLANLVAEFTKGVEKGDSEEHGRLDREVMTITASPLPYWELYVDGNANQRSSEIGIVMISLKQIIIEKSLRLEM